MASIEFGTIRPFHDQQQMNSKCRKDNHNIFWRRFIVGSSEHGSLKLQASYATIGWQQSVAGGDPPCQGPIIVLYLFTGLIQERDLGQAESHRHNSTSSAIDRSESSFDCFASFLVPRNINRWIWAYCVQVAETMPSSFVIAAIAHLDVEVFLKKKKGQPAKSIVRRS